ncbi:uncharacterized protein LOC141646440 [Silene latifolia]|uniref:uncharacterized protein LOC141646440 n=1 Tax=Silene latifolia TaxID=37657 RepID=UPI003D780357
MEMEMYRAEGEKVQSSLSILDFKSDLDLDEDDMDGVEVEPYIYHHLRVLPLVEIFKISVRSIFPGRFRVYGDIKVIDKHDHYSFSIYHRSESDPQFLVSGDNLSLTTGNNLDKNNAIIISSADNNNNNVFLQVDLVAFSDRFAASNKSWITLDRTLTHGKKDGWDEEYCSKTASSREKGNAFNLQVDYAIYPYAVTAIVNILFFSKDDDFDSLESKPEDDYYPDTGDDITDYTKNDFVGCVNLYGSVTSVSSNNGESQRTTSLFSKQIENYVNVRSGSFINLDRSVVVVPAYSSLQIETSLFDAENRSVLAEGRVEFRPRDLATAFAFKKDIIGINGRIRVQVVWNSPYYQLCRTNDDTGDMLETTLDSSSDEAPFKRHKVESDEWVLPWQPSDWVLPSNSMTDCLLEVYSVVVYSKEKPFKFYGSVHATTGWSSECILSIDKSSPLLCDKSGMPLIGRGARVDSFSVLDYRHLGLFVDFRDVSSGKVISHGYVSTGPLNIDSVAKRRVCSVVRGQQGFAAVHYSIFPTAVCAQVNIKLISKCVSGVIKGVISAVYGNFEPGRCYQDELFTNFLFYDKDDECAKVNYCNSTVPLLKHLISMPIDSFLIIKADIRVSHPDSDNLSSQGRKSIKGKAKFLKNEDSPRKIGEHDDCYLDVTVNYHIT